MSQEEIREEMSQEETREEMSQEETREENTVPDEKKSARNYFGPWLMFLPLSFAFYEVVLRFVANLGGENVFGAVLAALSFGLLMTVPCVISKNEKADFWAGFAILELVAVIFGIEYFSESAFTTFMSPSDVTAGAGGIMSEYFELLGNVFKNGYHTIIMLEIPAAIYLVLGLGFKKTAYGRLERDKIFCLVIAAVLCWGTGSFVLTADENARSKYTSDYNYDMSVRSFGLISSVKLDLVYSAFGNPFTSSFEPSDDLPLEPPEPEEEEEEVSGKTATDIVKTVYGYNELPIDYEALMEETSDKTVKDMLSYVISQTPSKQNKYTGLFEGKNLIFITAEALTAEVIDPERTPTLYRLANKGIVFEDFYQPAWGGSTSTGEFSMMTGIMPTEGVNSMRTVTDKNMALTMGNQLMDLGYRSVAFHNGTYTYYGRNLTHEHLGYESFTAFGNGMEKLYEKGMIRTSDEDMMKATLGTYIDDQPFCAYYMSVSGHCPYYRTSILADRNWDSVKDLDKPVYVKAYLAMQMEFENALTYIVDTLEEKGIADDTVIVIGTDHYPYGLLPGEAWDIDRDYLPDLYGVKYYDDFVRDHNALIIWSGCLEESDPIVVSEPVMSLDVVPTLSNLFGLSYDSRLMTGRDVLSKADALVIWPNKSWKTARGTYNIYTNKFTPNEGVSVPDDYVDRVKAIVSNKVKFAKGLITSDFLNVVFGKSER